MRVALFPAPRTVEFAERPLPEVPRGWVLVKNVTSAICGSDKGLWFNGGGDAIHGHEVAKDLAQPTGFEDVRHSVPPQLVPQASLLS